ncbi:MAG: hypothetical protein U9O54_04750 [Chloroflexota bacterium]|nr:hypothetical protein [Chloroflexota bacterium]
MNTGNKHLLDQGYLRLILICLLLIGANLACNLPGKEESEDRSANETGEKTLVAQTLAAMITDTPIPSETPTPTETPSPTPTKTQVPGGIISGRVYLMDKDEAVHTRVLLIQDKKEIDSTRTDKDGNYTFVIEEAGKYSIRVSVMDLLDRCDDLRTLSGWPIVVRNYDGGGVTDTWASTSPITINIGDKITIDCELYCD